MAAQTKIILGVDTREFRRGIEKVDGSVKKLSGGMRNLGRYIGAAFVVDQLARFTKEAVRLGMEMEGVEQAFRQMATPELLDQLRTAVKGTVDDLELMKATTKAITLGLDQANLPQYFEFARRRAKATGESVDYLVNSIVDGLGRESKRVIDNLGISQQAMADEMARGLTFAEAFNKLMTEQMATLPQDTETLAEMWGRVRTEFKNLTINIGRALVPVLIRLWKSLDVAYYSATRLGWAIHKLWMRLKGFDVDPLDAVADAIDRKLADAVADLLSDLPEVEGWTQKWRDVTEQTAEQTEKVKNDLKAANGYVLGLITKYKGLLIALKAGTLTQGAPRDISGDISGTGNVLPISIDFMNKATEGLEKMKDMIKETDKEMKALGATMMGVGMTLGAAMAGNVESFGDAVGVMVNQLFALASAYLIANQAKFGLVGLAAAGLGLGVLKGLFNQWASGNANVTAFAEGGIVTGPTLGLVGEAGPEAIIPLDKMDSMMGGGELTTRISGRDLLVILNKESKVSKNIYGGLS
jgi:hypothetical protein